MTLPERYNAAVGPGEPISGAEIAGVVDWLRFSLLSELRLDYRFFKRAPTSTRRCWPGRSCLCCCCWLASTKCGRGAR